MPAAAHLQVPRQHGLFVHHGTALGAGSVAHYLKAAKSCAAPWRSSAAANR